jgi:hypothetical protein
MALVATACRPPIGGSVEPSASSIAGELKPSAEIRVIIHLPGAPDVLTAPLAYAAASEAIAAAGVSIDQIAPSADEEPLNATGSETELHLYFATPAAVSAADVAGRDQLVMIGNLQQRSSKVLVAPSSGATTAADLSGTTVLVQGIIGDEIPLLALLAREGAENVTAEFPADPSLPLDLTPLFDGSVSAAFLASYDGLARAQEFISAETGAPVGADGISVIDLGDTAEIQGLGLWAASAALEIPNLEIAAALVLIGLTSGLAFCRDLPVDCAAVFEQGGQTDRFGDALIWSLDQFNASIWPAPAGVLSTTAAGSAGANVTDRILTLALEYLPSEIDRIGEGWVSSGTALPLE